LTAACKVTVSSGKQYGLAVGDLVAFVFDDFGALACTKLDKVVAQMQMTRVRVVPIFIVSVWVGERDKEGGVRPSQKCDCRESMRIV
jgi:hypothetical protein